MAKKYGYLMDKWWKVPEEEYIYALSGMRIHTGIAVLLWIIASICLLATVVFYFGENQSLSIGLGMVSLILAVIGFFQLSKSNIFKKAYEEEKKKFELASSTHYETKRSLIEITTLTNNELNSQLTKGMEKAVSFKEFVAIFSSMLITTNQAKEELKHVYQTNKFYDYNLYEAKEIEAFKDVDNYITYEEEFNHLHSIFEIITKCKEAAEENNEKDFQHTMEILILKLNDSSEGGI
jgi:hypothetical protein